MRIACIKAIVRKDGIQAVRNRLVLMALLAGVIFSLVYYALPSSVEEAFNLAVYDDSQLFSSIAETEEEGIVLTFFSSEEEVEKAVKEGDYIAGIVFPKGFSTQLMKREKPALTLYFNSEQPESVRTSIQYFIKLAVEYMVLGYESLEINAEILGEDMAGKQIPLRENSISLYLVFALFMEMWTISTLIVEESAAGTLRAVLVTPASPSDVIMSKGVVGIGYSLAVAFVILVLTQSVRGNLPVLFLGIFLGAILAVSMGLFFGSLTESISGSYIYVGVPFLILVLPGLLIFIPDITLSAIKLIPTYYLVNAFNQILNFDAGLADVWKNFLIIAVCDVVFFFLGVFALRRRYS